MALQFHESMNGRLVEPSGAAHSVDIDVCAETTHARALLRTGIVRLSGVVRARPWADDVVAAGTLRISPLRGRRLEYDLRFTNDEGRAFRLFGQKDLHLLRPRLGMTELAVQLTSDGVTLATGSMAFSLDDLASFAAGWSAQTSIPRLDLEGPPRSADAPPVRAVLDPDRLELLRAFGEAVIEASDVVPEVDRKTLDATNSLLNHLPPHAQTIYRTGLTALDGVARATHRQPFTELSIAERRDVLSNVRDASLALGAPLKTAHFSRRDFLDRIGVESYDNPIAERPPRWASQISTPSDLDDESTVPCDVVIVGTGAGGAPLAAALAEQGLAVALVEAGKHRTRKHFSGGPEQRLMRFWNDGGMNITVGNVPIVVPTGKLVGGSTAINSGTCLELPPEVLREWREAGFPADFEPERFDGWVARVRKEMQVAPGQAPWLGEIAAKIAAGAEALRERGHEIEHGPLPRNAPGCDGQGLCPVGCPTGAKRSSDVSWVPRALKAGAHCFTEMSVRRIHMRGNRAVAVEAQGQDEFGIVKTLRLKARAVVLSCGTLATPLLLKRNGFRLPRIGHGLSVHPAHGAFAMYEDSLGEPWRAIPQGYEVTGPVDERVRFEGFYVPPGLAAASLPFDGAKLTHWMEQIDRVGQFGFMVRDENRGRVLAGPKGRPLLRYTMSEATLERFTQATSVLCEMLLASGASEVATGIAGVDSVRTRGQARAIATMKLKPSQFRPMGFHPLGTCAMGASADVGVVDFDHRVFGTQNLYVVDGSSVPTSLGVNPQMTIMSMALRAADILAAELA